MTDREAIKATIEEAYEARAEGNIDALMATFHPDAVFELAGSKSLLAVAGAVEGHINVRKSITEFISAFHFVHRDILCVLVDGDRAAVRSSLTVKFIPKNKEFTSEVFDLFRFENGKIIELVEFVDTALIKDLIHA